MGHGRQPPSSSTRGRSPDLECAVASRGNFDQRTPQIPSGDGWVSATLFQDLQSSFEISSAALSKSSKPVGGVILSNSLAVVLNILKSSFKVHTLPKGLDSSVPNRFAMSRRAIVMYCLRVVVVAVVAFSVSEPPSGRMQSYNGGGALQVFFSASYMCERSLEKWFRYTEASTMLFS